MREREREREMGDVCTEQRQKVQKERRDISKKIAKNGGDGSHTIVIKKEGRLFY